MLKQISLVLALVLLSSVSSGCTGTATPASCPEFYEQEPKPVLPKTQVKSFDKISFIYDDSLPIFHAVCRFNNTDGDNDMKNALVLNSYDFGVILEHSYYNEGIILQENTRSKQFWPEQ